MPSIYYLRQFYPGGFYHIYNRGANKQNLYHIPADYNTFIQIFSYYLLHPTGAPRSILSRANDSNKVPILVGTTAPSCTLLSYCLMPNHFHFMLRQDDGDLTISDFMRRVSVTYAMYYNERYHHSGTIFQGKYKNVMLENEYQWLYLSKYIHRNPSVIKNKQRSDLCSYPYSSYPNYLGLKSERWLNTSLILGNDSKEAINSYQRFVENSSDYGDIEKLTLDSNELQI